MAADSLLSSDKVVTGGRAAHGSQDTAPRKCPLHPPAHPATYWVQEGPGTASYTRKKAKSSPLQGRCGGRYSSKVTFLKQVCANSSLRRTQETDQEARGRRSFKVGEQTSFLASSRLASGQMTTSRLHCTGSFPAKPATVTLIYEKEVIVRVNTGTESRLHSCPGF